MAKRKGDQPNSDTQGRGGNDADKIASEPGKGGPSSPGLAKIDSPDLVPPQTEQAAAPATSAAPIVLPAPVAAIVDPPKVDDTSPEPKNSESKSAEPKVTETKLTEPKLTEPKITAPKSDEPESLDSEDFEPERFEPKRVKFPITRFDDVRPGDAGAGAADAAASSSGARAKRLMPIAATIAIAAAVGAMAGSIATAGFGRLWASQPVAPAASVVDTRALKDSIARINADVVALKSAVDTSGRSSNAQLVKLGDRLDRFERAQAEPAAKLAKLAEAVDRIEHRAPAPAPVPPPIASHDTNTTGSIAALAPPPQPPMGEPARPLGPPVIEGWVVRSVYNGAALIQGRMGLIEVEPGDTLPGLGRIENIRRQDGRWVVVTSKGLIVTR